jgi:hypothetical protein
MLEVQSLRSLSHHRTPRLLDATHQLTTVLPELRSVARTSAPAGHSRFHVGSPTDGVCRRTVVALELWRSLSRDEVLRLREPGAGV